MSANHSSYFLVVLYDNKYNFVIMMLTKIMSCIRCSTSKPKSFFPFLLSAKEGFLVRLYFA